MKNNSKIFNLVSAAVMSALIVVCSWLSIPFVIPFTMQTFAIFFALELLGPVMGSTSILVYILLGAAGLPVFSGFSGGIGHLFGPTGGYIVGFLFTGLLYALCQRLFKRSKLSRVLIPAIGMLGYYTLGTLWFCHFTGATLWKGFVTCVAPYVLFDSIKAALAVTLAEKVKSILNKQRG